VTKILHRSGVAWKRKGRADIVQFADDGFILGTTEPTWANSGSRIPQASLTRNETINLITSADGQVISGLHLPYGRIEVRHKNVTIRDCIINIGWAPNGTGAGQRLLIQQNAAIVANVNYNTTGLNVEYVTCDPINAGANGTADDANVSAFYFMSGARFYRCSARNVTDSYMPDEQAATPSAPVQILGCYSQNRWLPNDPGQTDGTHNDGIQLAGGDGHVLRGNSLHNPSGGVTDPASGFVVKGQCVVFTPYHSPLTNVTVADNWFYGAYTQVALYVAKSYGYGTPTGTILTGNRHMGQCVWPILITNEARATATVSGNVVGTGGITWNSGTVAAGQPAPINQVAAPA